MHREPLAGIVHRPFRGGVETHTNRSASESRTALCIGLSAEGSRVTAKKLSSPCTFWVHRPLCGGVETHVENGRGASALPRKGRDAHAVGRHAHASDHVHRPFRGRAETHKRSARESRKVLCIGPSAEGSRRTSASADGYDSGASALPRKGRGALHPCGLATLGDTPVHRPFRGGVESHIRITVGERRLNDTAETSSQREAS
jgi:hypothetical protein